MSIADGFEKNDHSWYNLNQPWYRILKPAIRTSNITASLSKDS
jgi:hypothetical protein